MIACLSKVNLEKEGRRLIGAGNEVKASSRSFAQ
jgi:hypothetical protein